MSTTLNANRGALKQPPATAPQKPPGKPPAPSKPKRGPSVDDRRDPQSGVSDVTQLLTLTEESVMQNTMVRARARITHIRSAPFFIILTPPPLSLF